MAVKQAERSAFEFIRVGTIPLLLAIDLFLGYVLGLNQIIGIILITIAFIFLTMNHGLSRRGLGYVIFSTVNAAATISLYKYDIAHFNSVTAEQSIILAVLMAYLFLMARFAGKENPVSFLKQPIFLIQSLGAGMGNVLLSFAYLFAAASIITSAKRGLGVFWSILSGKFYFHEKRAIAKLTALAVIGVGLILLAI